MKSSDWQLQSREAKTRLSMCMHDEAWLDDWAVLAEQGHGQTSAYHAEMVFVVPEDAEPQAEVEEQTYVAVHIRWCAQPGLETLHGPNPAAQPDGHSAARAAPYEHRTLCQLIPEFPSIDLWFRLNNYADGPGDAMAGGC
jgi:hypothetical protein